MSTEHVGLEPSSAELAAQGPSGSLADDRRVAILVLGIVFVMYAGIAVVLYWLFTHIV